MKESLKLWFTVLIWEEFKWKCYEKSHRYAAEEQNSYGML